MINGIKKLEMVARSTPRMEKALPNLPMSGTVLIRLLRIADSAVFDYFEPVLRKQDLSEHSFHVLCLLIASKDGTATPSQLSDMIGTSRANMTRILKELQSAAWVDRIVVPRDRRRFIIHITQSGREKVNETVPEMAGPIENAFSGLSHEEIDLLSALLKKVTRSLSQNDRPDDY